MFSLPYRAQHSTFCEALLFTNCFAEGAVLFFFASLFFATSGRTLQKTLKTRQTKRKTILKF
jgi:hypothetical protein